MIATPTTIVASEERSVTEQKSWINATVIPISRMRAKNPKHACAIVRLYGITESQS